MHLMRDTFGTRRMEMKGHVGQPMCELGTNYPMFKDEKYVVHMY